MTISARFTNPLSSRPPRGTRLIEAFSLELGRRIQCHGEEAFGQWICLETEPAVEAFCERPAYLNRDAKVLVDYWVRRRDGEALVMLGEPSDPGMAATDDTEFPVRYIPPAELAAARIWIRIWERMMPLLVCCRTLMSHSMRRAILKFAGESRPFHQIDHEFACGDPVLVCATIFALLHGGRLRAPQLWTEMLSYQTAFVAAKDSG